MASFLSIPQQQYHRINSGAAASSSSSSSARPPLLLLRPPRAVTIRLVDGSGRTIEVEDDEWTCGSDGSKASFALGKSPAVEAVHVKLTQKRRRRGGGGAAPAAAAQVFLTALANVDDGVLGDSRAWLDGQPLRPGVQYVIGSGQRVDMGEQQGAGGGGDGGGAPAAAAAFVVEFAEASGRDPLVEMMLLAGAAGSAADKVREALK